MKLIPLITIRNEEMKFEGKFLKLPLNPNQSLTIKSLSSFFTELPEEKEKLVLIFNENYIIEKDFIIYLENSINFSNNLKTIIELNNSIVKNNGIEITMTGRLKGVNMATKWSIKEGRLKAMSYNYNLDNITDYVQTKWGKYGLKIKIS